MARRKGAVRATLARLSARAKKLLLMRIYLYAIASGNTHLLKMFRVRGARKGRKRRSKRRRKGKRRMSAKARRAMLRNLAKARRARRRKR